MAGEPFAELSDLVAAFDLPVASTSASEARRLVRAVLASWRVGEAHGHDAQLIASELVTNAVRHGADHVKLRLQRRDELLEIAVEDGAAVLPDAILHRVGGLYDESGRGLMILAAVSSDWGVDELPHGGKRVWAVLTLDAADG